MPGGALAEGPRVEELSASPAFGRIGRKCVERLDLGANAVGVVGFARASPDNGSFNRMQHVPKSWHAAVMKIGATGPNSVERRGDVAGGLVDVGFFAEMGEPALAVGVAMGGRECVEPHTVGLQVVDGDELLGIDAAGTIRAVAICTDAIERDAASLGEL